MQKQIEYEKAITTKYPEQQVFAIANDPAGKPNPITLGWTMITSANPPMMAISVSPKRYSANVIRNAKCFTISFPSAQMAKESLFFGSKSGRDIDKLKQSNLAHEPAKVIDSILLTDAVANFECTLESELVTGDHIIFVGKIVASHVNTENKKRLYTTAPGYEMSSVTIDK